MFIPTTENYSEMTPKEFEEYVLFELCKQFQDKGISDFSFVHDTKKDAYDGTYQIDGEIKFFIMGAEIDILVECKQFKEPIKREHIQSLHDKIRSIGAHKGIFVTTSHYQSGAIKYAHEHGIALISIVNNELRYHVRSLDGYNPFKIPLHIKEMPFSMVMQTQTTDTSVSISYIDDTDELYNYVVQNKDGENL